MLDKNTTHTPEMDEILLTEDDLKIDEPAVKPATKKTNIFNRFAQSVRTLWENVRFNRELNSTSLSPTLRNFIDEGERNVHQLDAAPEKYNLPGITITQDAKPYVAPKYEAKKKSTTSADQESESAETQAQTRADNERFLKLLNDYFGAGLNDLTQPWQKDALQETLRKYSMKEGITFGGFLGVVPAKGLILTNTDPLAKSSFSIRKEANNSISSVYTGDRTQFPKQVGAWAKTLLINQTGPVTVALTGGTAEEKYLMKLELEALSQERGEDYAITVEKFDENTVSPERRAALKKQWEGITGRKPATTPEPQQTQSQSVSTQPSDVVKPQPQPTNTAEKKPVVRRALSEGPPPPPTDLQQEKTQAPAKKPATGGFASRRDTVWKESDLNGAAAVTPEKKSTNIEKPSFSRPANGSKTGLPRGVTRETFARAKEHVIASGHVSASELTKQFGMTDTKARAILDKLEEQGVLTPRGIMPPKAA